MEFEVGLDDKGGIDNKIGTSTVESDSNPSLEFSSAISSCIGGRVVVERTGAGAGVANATGTGGATGAGGTSFKVEKSAIFVGIRSPFLSGGPATLIYLLRIFMYTTLQFHPAVGHGVRIGFTHESPPRYFTLLSILNGVGITLG